MSTSKPQVKRTYGSQNSRPRVTAKEISSELSTPLLHGLPGTSLRRKRPLADLFPNGSPPKKTKASCKSSAVKCTVKATKRPTKKEDRLTQLHLPIDESIYRTCPHCDMTYTRGTMDDENLHKTHCLRVRKGMEWGRDEDKEIGRDDGICSLVEEDVAFGNSETGRIVAIKPTGGKLGSKLSSYLKTVNLALSAPAIPASTFKHCKVYLFLLRQAGCSREKMVGCVVVQRISKAMEVATKEEVSKLENAAELLVHVEDDLYCKPEELPTAMGIPRLFVSSAHRRKGIVRALLDAAARTFIHGCPLDPASGEIAFSQPTSVGRKVMEKWGRGGVRIYKE